MNITDIVIVKTSHGADAVFLNTDLPDAVWTTALSNLSPKFHAARDTGEKYCKEHFPGIKIKIIESP